MDAALAVLFLGLRERREPPWDDGRGRAAELRRRLEARSERVAVSARNAAAASAPSAVSAASTATDARTADAANGCAAGITATGGT